MTSLQDKITIARKLTYDLQSERDETDKTIQELREQINFQLDKYKNDYTNCEMIGYENSYLKGRIESLKDVLALIGKKK